MDSFYEGSTPTLTITFSDQDGNSITPESFQYRIENEDGTVIRDWTTVTPASSIMVVLSETDTAMVDETKAQEKRVVYMEFTYDGGKKGKGVYVFYVRNLSPL